MDIIDIMLARAMTPQGKTETYVAKANAAAAKAEKAKQDATEAIATVEAAADEIATAKSEAEDLLTAAQEALETAQAAQINTLDTEDVDAEVKKMTVNTNVVDGTSAKTLQVVTTYPDNTLNTQNVTKLYKATGTNEDGTMTQKAINDALAAKLDSSALNNYASKDYVNQAIATIPVSSNDGTISNINLGIGNAGKIVVVGTDGYSTTGTITEESLIEALIKSGSYAAENVVGLEIDYENKTFMRLQEAYGKSAGSDFDSYAMYGGRMRCNVAANGAINAFYGDSEYTEDGSNGQVMFYQPKFYYERIPMKIEPGVNGTIIRKETLLLSPIAQTGFKFHPLFIGDNEEELDYVLLPVYEGSLDNNKLVSIAGKKPISNITLDEAEAYANANGSNWHLTNMEFESAMQMLEMVELGTMNGQNALEKGISNITSVSNYNCSSYTGSTASLGNGTGYAASTVNEINGTETTYYENGKRAIAYRCMENPWGNIWRMVGGAKVIGTNENNGGLPYFCHGTNYSSGNYDSIGFKLPSSYGWISAMGYGNKDNDWIYMPIECSGANSATPVGDNLWTTPGLNGENIIIAGGCWSFEESNGPFFYACDRASEDSAQKSYGARPMFKPTKNEIYTANITAWAAKMEG